MQNDEPDEFTEGLAFFAAPNWNNDDSGNKIAGSEWIDRQGKRLAGRTLDGVIHNEYPRVK